MIALALGAATGVAFWIVLLVCDRFPRAKKLSWAEEMAAYRALVVGRVISDAWWRAADARDHLCGRHCNCERAESVRELERQLRRDATRHR